MMIKDKRKTISLENIPFKKGEKCKAHIFPRASGCSLTTVSSRKIDNRVGSEFDRKMVTWARRHVKYVEGKTNNPPTQKKICRCYLSLLHSAVLFMADRELRMENYDFFYEMIIKGLQNLGRIREEEWGIIKQKCIFVNAKDFEPEHDNNILIVGFKYNYAVYGIFCLTGNLPKDVTKFYLIE